MTTINVSIMSTLECFSTKINKRQRQTHNGWGSIALESVLMEMLARVR